MQRFQGLLMTMAICTKCGEKKLGALTACRGCRFEPTDTVDQAKSMLLSDHHLSPKELETASQSLRHGQPPIFDEASIKEMVEIMDISKPTYILGVRKTSWIMIGIAIVIGSLFGTCVVTLIAFLDRK
jgi:hypothetical protein